MEAVARMLGSEKHKWVQSTGPLGLAGSERGKHRYCSSQAGFELSKDTFKEGARKYERSR